MNTIDKMFYDDQNKGRVEILDKHKESICGMIQYNNNGVKTFLLNIRKKPRAM
jgi:hypothetical protein